MALPGNSINFGSTTGNTNIQGNQITGTNISINQANQFEDECLRHLRRTDPRHDKTRIEEAKGGLLKDVSCWIFEHHDYKQWLHNPESRLLWVRGDPGKGKTMLLCDIINELKKPTSNNSNPVPISYFFCQANHNQLNNATSVLFGLIYLLVDEQRFLISHLEKHYSSADKGLFEGINAWFALSEIFTSILDDLRLPQVILLVDALDECETDLLKLLRLIRTSSSRAKWIVSSRNKPDIEEELDAAVCKIPLSLELNANLISNAVRIYIQHMVQFLAVRKRYDDSLRHDVETYLVDVRSSTGNPVRLFKSLNFNITHCRAKPNIYTFTALWIGCILAS
ncbi:heterokaryon incompatibility protein [Xylaria curta]|nr:heterokaryon incompatibility protein [Xylaria curta]